MTSFHAFVFINPIEPKHAIIFPPRQLLPSIDGVLIACGHPNTLKVHYDMITMWRDVDTTAIAFDPTP